MIQVICADFKTLPLDTFDGCDHLITDPPYSAGTHRNAHSTGTNGRGPVQRDFGFACLDPADRIAACGLAKRISRWSIIFSDFAKGTDEFEGDPEAQAQAGHFMIEGDAAWRFQMVHSGLEWVRLVPWVRWSQPQITGDRPCTGAEAVLHFHAKGRKRWNGPGGMTHYARRSLRGDAKHPTEKPLDLMLDIVSWFTDPGEAIIDPFAGAGTTGLAALILDREAVLVERSEEWAAQAQVRVTATELSERDRKRVVEWIASTHEEITETMNDPATTKPARARAERRLADVHRAEACL